MSKEEKQSKWQWFLMVIFIPAVFALILAVVVLYYMGIDVGERAQQAFSFLPFVQSEEEQLEEETSMEEKIVQLELESEEYITQISQLEREINRLEETIIQLEKDKSEAVEQQEEEESVEDQSGSAKDVVRTLEVMTASKAADIVSEMDQVQAAMYLRMMKVDARSQILSRMDPKTAAQIIHLLGN